MLSLREMFRPSPTLSDPDRSNGKLRRHVETYAALIELADRLKLDLGSRPAFEIGMGVEDLYEKVGKVARAAIAELKKR